MSNEATEIDYLDAAAWDSRAHERMRWLRENAPIHWNEKSGLWVVAKYQDVVEISKNPEIFCSGQGVRPRLPARQALIDEDDPKHCQLRNTINRGFTPRMVKHLEESFEQITKDAIDAVARDGHCDFVDSIAVPLPLILIAEMIGMRSEDWSLLHRWSDAMMRAEGNFDDPEILGAAARSAQEYAQYIGEIIEARRVQPREDLVSKLVAAGGLLGHFDIDSIEGTGAESDDFLELANDELIMVLITLMVAGNETTRNALSGSVEALLRRPELQGQVAARPELLPDAVEELLRFVSPVHSFSRTATCDTELRGQKIAKGEKVLMLYPSANRDSDEFDDPDELRLDRKPQHVAFGIGHHFCLGANLARMELRVALRELLRRLPDMRFADSGPVIEAHALVRSCTQMQVLFTPEAS